MSKVFTDCQGLNMSVVKFTIAAAGAVGTVTFEDGALTVTRRTTGIYRVALNRYRSLVELAAIASLDGSPSTAAAFARVTTIDVDGDTTTPLNPFVEVTTMDDNATPAAVDLTAGTVTVIIFWKDSAVAV